MHCRKHLYCCMVLVQDSRACLDFLCIGFLQKWSLILPARPLCVVHAFDEGVHLLCLLNARLVLLLESFLHIHKQTSLLQVAEQVVWSHKHNFSRLQERFCGGWGGEGGG